MNHHKYNIDKSRTRENIDRQIPCIDLLKENFKLFTKFLSLSDKEKVRTDEPIISRH